MISVDLNGSNKNHKPSNNSGSGSHDLSQNSKIKAANEPSSGSPMQIKSPLSGSKQERDEPKSSSNPVVNVFRKFTGFGSKKAVVEESKSSLVDDPT